MAKGLRLGAEQEEKLLGYLQDRHSAAQRYYEEEMEPKIAERIDIYYAKEAFYARMFERLSEVSSLTSSDVADTIEWVMPSLMKIFFGGESIIQIQGTQAEDLTNAETMQELIDYQIQRRNKGFLKFHNWMKYALITNMATIKCSWERETKPVAYVQQMTAAEMAALQAQQQGVRILAAEAIAPGLFSVRWQAERVIKNQPVLEFLLASEFRFAPDARDVDDLDFSEHVQAVTLDAIRRKVKSGDYRSLSDAEEQRLDGLTYTRLDEKTRGFTYQQNWAANDDTPNRKVEIRETYVKYDINEDGLLEDVIVWWSGDIVLRIEENAIGRHPFFLLSPTLDPHQLFAERGFSEMIGQIQHLKTALMRLLVYNITLANNPQAAVDMTKFQDIDDLLEGRQYWRINGDPHNAVFPIPSSQVSPLTLPFMEYLEGQKETKTGVTRYNQGTDANSLNKTASGMSMIMGAANQRLELIARIFAETGFVQLFRYIAMLNQLYIDDDTTIRLTNKTLRINPANLAGDFDFTISAGIGTGTKEVSVQQLQLLLGMYPQLLGIGIATPHNVYKCVKKLIEEMGYKNAADYVTDPQQLVQQAGVEKGPEVKTTQSLRIDFDSLPPAVKAQLLQAQGIQASAAEFVASMELRAAAKAAERGGMLVGPGAERQAGGAGAAGGDGGAGVDLDALMAAGVPPGAAAGIA